MIGAALDAHLPVLPVLLPLATALLLLAGGGRRTTAAARHRALARARWLSLASLALGLLVALRLAAGAADGDLHVYRLGDWPAPFGIVLVIDRLSALMLVLTQVVALPVLLYAAAGWDARGRQFHALLQFQVMGLAGAFSTGDLFNLFVFFELLLIASYVLLVHGLGRERLRRALPYVALNLIASALFLLGVALVYGFTGTLNLAELGLRVPRLEPPESTLLQSAALLLLVVFGFKAALLPLHLWLPSTYAAASAPAAALFALMTKVGVYAIVRVHGVAFGGVPPNPAAGWLLPLALATCVLAVLGAAAAHTLPRLVAWLNIASVGTVLAAVGLFSAGAWSAAMYYLVHSTLVVAALFLLSELVSAQRGHAGGRLEPAAPVSQPALLGTMMLLAGASVAGLPPLPGFIGKLMILQASGGAAAPWVWTVLLAVGLLTLIVVARAGSMLFWSVRVEALAEGSAQVPPLAMGRGTGARTVGAALALLGAGVALAVAAGPFTRYTDAAAAQLLDRAAYARAVLGDAAAAGAVRPYQGAR